MVQTKIYGWSETGRVKMEECKWWREFGLEQKWLEQKWGSENGGAI